MMHDIEYEMITYDMEYEALIETMNEFKMVLDDVRNIQKTTEILCNLCTNSAVKFEYLSNMIGEIDDEICKSGTELTSATTHKHKFNSKIMLIILGIGTTLAGGLKGLIIGTIIGISTKQIYDRFAMKEIQKLFTKSNSNKNSNENSNENNNENSNKNSNIKSNNQNLIKINNHQSTNRNNAVILEIIDIHGEIMFFLDDIKYMINDVSYQLQYDKEKLDNALATNSEIDENVKKIDKLTKYFNSNLLTLLLNNIKCESKQTMNEISDKCWITVDSLKISNNQQNPKQTENASKSDETLLLQRYVFNPFKKRIKIMLKNGQYTTTKINNNEFKNMSIFNNKLNYEFGHKFDIENKSKLLLILHKNRLFENEMCNDMDILCTTILSELRTLNMNYEMVSNEIQMQNMKLDTLGDSLDNKTTKIGKFVKQIR